jgi:hypothetical protein
MEQTLLPPVTTTMDQHIRNQMSIMAWGMAALCAWVLFLSATGVHGIKATAAETPFSVSVPTTSK